MPAVPAARPSSLIDQQGRPLMLTTAHQAADIGSQELSNFLPPYRSADAAYLPERQQIVSRIHALARNDGWTGATLNRYVDNVIGANFRLSYMPDHEALGIDYDTCFDFANKVEIAWRQYAYDPRCYIDAEERLNFAGLAGLLFRHRMADGEALAVMEFLNRPWFASRTAVRVVSPERLSNPQNTEDTATLRRGVELSKRGVPIRYHIQAAHPGDQLYVNNTQDFFTWVPVDRRTPWGRPIVIHQFEPDEAGQTRGKSLLATVVKKIFMTNKYADAEMQAAVLNAVLAAYIESPMDSEAVADAITDASETDSYNTARATFHEGSKLTLNGNRIPILYPGEKIGFVDSARPNVGYADFEERALRYAAAATGQTYEEFSADFSKTNYSSIRAALLGTYKFLDARGGHFGQGVCTPIFAAWLEDAVDNGTVKLPKGAPDFWKAYAAYTQADWAGPGRGWVDPTKEAEASVMRVDAGVSDLQTEAAQAGTDWRRVAQRRAYERQYYKKLGLPEPQSAQVGTETTGATSPSNDAIDETDAKERNKSTGARRVSARNRIPQVSATM